MDEKHKEKMAWLRKQSVVWKIIIQRGYMWCNVPLLAIVGAGTLAKYLPMLHFWELTLITLVIICFVGWIDKHFKFVDTEQVYLTEINPLMMKVINQNKDKDQYDVKIITADKNKKEVEKKEE